MKSLHMLIKALTSVSVNLVTLKNLFGVNSPLFTQKYVHAKTFNHMGPDMYEL
jgi:hypothetical protein